MKLAISLSLLTIATSALAGSVYDLFPLRRDADMDLLVRDTPIVGNLTNDQAIRAYEAQCSKINDAVGNAQVLADIRNVTANSIAIQRSFQNIGAQLAVIDSQNLDPQKFAPAWKNLAQKWTNILWGSRTTASNTVAYTTQFTTIIMPFVANTSTPVPIDLSISVLESWIQQADRLKAGANATAQAFTDLQTELIEFSARFQNFASAQNATFNARIEELNSEIKVLKDLIEVYDRNIAIIAGALGATVFADIALLALFPEAAPLIIGVGVVAVAGEATAWGILSKQRAAAQRQISLDRSEISQIQVQLKAIQQANSTLQTIHNNTLVMTDQLQAFNGIWNAVVSDSNQVINYLNMAKDGLNNPLLPLMPQILWGTLNTVDCFYEAMADALNEYAIGIVNGGIPPPVNGRVGFLDVKAVSQNSFSIAAQNLVSDATRKALARGSKA